MSIVKAFSVGEGDTSYIIHNSDNFTIIDCCIRGERSDEIRDDILSAGVGKGIHRFISTHPDEDHFGGIEILDDANKIQNFYVVKNNACKPVETPSFKRYCELRDGPKAFHISKGCSRRWMNLSNDQRKTSGINILWPDLNNASFQEALEHAEAEVAYNNLSAVIRYSVEGSASFVWLGDLETDFMEAIEDDIDLPKTTIVFASHHGRQSGKIPDSWLDKLQPEIVIIGEAPSRHLHYYSGYCTLTQNSTGDIIMDTYTGGVDFYVGSDNYGARDWLNYEVKSKFPNYIGTLSV